MKHQRQAGFRDEPGGVHAAGRGRGVLAGRRVGRRPAGFRGEHTCSGSLRGPLGRNGAGGSAAQRGSHARLAQPSVLGPLEPSVGSHLVTPQSPRASPNVGFIYSLPTF